MFCFCSLRKFKLTQERNQERLWSDENFREHMIAQRNTPESLAAKSARSKAQFASPEARVILSERGKKNWTNPEFRTKVIGTLKAKNIRKRAIRFAPLVDMDETHIDAILSGKDKERIKLIRQLVKRLHQIRRERHIQENHIQEARVL
jgi:hypothetical protein